MKHKYPVKAGHFYALSEDTLAGDLMFEIMKDRSNTYEDGIAVVCVQGPLDQHPSGVFDNYDDILERYEEACDDEDTQAVILTFDSPGGDAYGMIEARRKIMRLMKRYEKPTYAYSNECCFSAAYGLASACQEIWVPSTGGVGSVGVVRPTKDESKAFERAGVKMTYVCTPPGKGIGRPGLPVDKTVINRIQGEVDQFGALFFKGVSKSRGISVDEILGLEANVFHGKKALKVGLADGIAGWDDFVAMVRAAHGGSTEISTSTPINGESDNGKQEHHSMKAKKAAQTLLALNAKKATTLQALIASKSSDERTKLTADLDKLIGEISVASQMAYKKTKKVEETEEETGEEEDEEDERCDDDEEEDEEEDESSMSSSSGSDSSSSDGDSSSMSTDAAEKSTRAFLKAKTGLYTPQRLLRLCKQVTGKESPGEIFGALDAMGVRLKSAIKTEKRVAKLEESNTRAKVNALLNKASAEGKVTPAQVPALKEQGMKDYGWLKGYVATLAPKVNADEVEYDLSANQAPTMASQINMLGGSNVALTDQQKILQAATQSLGGDEQKLFGEVQKQVQVKHQALGFTPNGKSGPRF